MLVQLPPLGVLLLAPARRDGGGGSSETVSGMSSFPSLHSKTGLEGAHMSQGRNHKRSKPTIPHA